MPLRADSAARVAVDNNDPLVEKAVRAVKDPLSRVRHRVLVPGWIHSRPRPDRNLSARYRARLMAF